jgi:putative transcriptional regulator
MDDSSQLCLTGSLLLAGPALREPTFHRTVILITDHRHDRGAHGYILNRPCAQTAGELLTAAEFAPLAAVPIFFGGPVSKEQLVFAALAWEPSAGLQCSSHLTREEAVQRIGAGEHLRAFIGYSGWAEGQLENEIKHRTWIIARPDAAVLDPAAGPGLWQSVLDRMGPWFRLISRAPDDPALN